MNKKLICTLIAGLTLGVSAPVFAEPHRGYDRGHDRHSSHFRGYDRHDFRGHGRHDFRGHDRYGYRGYSPRPVVVYERPYVVQRPVYVEQPVYQSQQSQGIGAIIGAAIGGIYDSHQQY